MAESLQQLEAQRELVAVYAGEGSPSAVKDLETIDSKIAVIKVKAEATEVWSAFIDSYELPDVIAEITRGAELVPGTVSIEVGDESTVIRVHASTTVDSDLTDLIRWSEPYGIQLQKLAAQRYLKATPITDEQGEPVLGDDNKPTFDEFWSWRVVSGEAVVSGLSDEPIPVTKKAGRASKVGKGVTIGKDGRGERQNALKVLSVVLPSGSTEEYTSFAAWAQQAGEYQHNEDGSVVHGVNYRLQLNDHVKEGKVQSYTDKAGDTFTADSF